MNKIEHTQMEIDALIAKKERFQTEKDDWEWVNENRPQLYAKYMAQGIVVICVHKKAVVRTLTSPPNGIWTELEPTLDDDDVVVRYAVEICISDLLRRKGEAELALSQKP